MSWIKTITDGNGKTQTLSYDKLGRTTRVDVTGGQWFTFAYDANGNVIERKDGAGAVTPEPPSTPTTSSIAAPARRSPPA